MPCARPSERKCRQNSIGDVPVLVCDVEFPEPDRRHCASSSKMGVRLSRIGPFNCIGGLCRGCASRFIRRQRPQFLRAMDISCYSLIVLIGSLPRLFEPRCLGRDDFDFHHPHGQRELRLHGSDQGGARFVAVIFLAKSFSQFSRVRFNAVAPGLLKSSASAGIPGYVEAYLYAEQATLCRKSLLARRKWPPQPRSY